MTRSCLLAPCLFIVGITGCSRGEPTVATTAVVGGGSTVAAAIPSLTKASDHAPARQPAEQAPPAGQPTQSATETAAAETPATPFLEMSDLFAPPKMVVPVVTAEPEPKPEPDPEPTPSPVQVIEQPKPEKRRPELRLVGFVEVEGLKALLSVEGELNVVTIGDSPEGLKIIAIEPPKITLKHGDDGEEFQMNLYEQPWFHPAGAVLGERKSIGGKPVLQKNSSPPAAVGPPNGSGNPSSIPQLPGTGREMFPGFPVPAGFGGSVGPPPSLPAPSGHAIPGAPANPTQNAPASNSKSSKKAPRSTKPSNPGAPGVTTPAGASGMSGILSGIGATISGAASSK